MSVRPAQRVKNRFVGSPPFALRRDDRDAVAQSYPSLASRLHKPRAARPNKRLFQLYAQPPTCQGGRCAPVVGAGPHFTPPPTQCWQRPIEQTFVRIIRPAIPHVKGPNRDTSNPTEESIIKPFAILPKREGGKWQEKGFRRRPGLTDDGMRRLGQAERTTSRRAFPVSFAVSGVRFAPVSLDFLRFSDPTVGGSNPPWRARPGATVVDRIPRSTAYPIQAAMSVFPGWSEVAPPPMPDFARGCQVSRGGSRDGHRAA